MSNLAEALSGFEALEILEVGDTEARVSVGHEAWGFRLDVTIAASKLSLEDLWDARQEAMNQEIPNNERWEKRMSTDQARVAKEMILHALHTLASDLDWVPFRTEIQDGDILDLHCRILLTDVDEEVKRVEAEFLRTVDGVRGLHVLDVPEELQVDSKRKSGN